MVVSSPPPTPPTTPTPSGAVCSMEICSPGWNVCASVSALFCTTWKTFPLTAMFMWSLTAMFMWSFPNVLYNLKNLSPSVTALFMSLFHQCSVQHEKPFPLTAVFTPLFSQCSVQHEKPFPLTAVFMSLFPQCSVLHEKPSPLTAVFMSLFPQSLLP